MKKELWFPSVEDAKRTNKFAIEKFRSTKAERFEVLSHAKIQDAIDTCKNKKGDVEIKSACLLKSFSDNHPFASANRRTAYIMMNEFLWKNGSYSVAKKKENTSHLFKELRRRNVSEKEIVEWYNNKG